MNYGLKLNLKEAKEKNRMIKLFNSYLFLNKI